MKKIITAAFCFFALAVFSQSNIVDVIIDNKPAKMNIVTGDYQFTDGSPTNITSGSNANANIHVVSKGETLYSISKKYDISMAQIKSVNNLESNFLNVGQKLAIGYSANRIIQDKTKHTVIKGETLYRIAINNNLSLAELKSINGLESNIISIGQELKLK